MVRRRPKRSTKLAENGPTRPNIMSCTAIGKETTARLQPNSSSHGTSITAEVARMPAADQQDDEGHADDDPGVVQLLGFLQRLLGHTGHNSSAKFPSD